MGAPHSLPKERVAFPVSQPPPSNSSGLRTFGFLTATRRTEADARQDRHFPARHISPSSFSSLTNNLLLCESG